MRRTFLVAAAAVLGLCAAGCGGVKQTSSGAGAGGPTTASNRVAAVADVHALLAMVQVPSGSRLATAPRDDEHEQLRDFIGVSASATASRTWIVHGDVRHLLSYVVSHLHPGSKWFGSGRGGSQPDVSQIRSWPPVRGVLDGRWLQVQAYAYGPRTYLTAQAQSQWVITRAAREQIPSNVTRITITVSNADGHRVHELTVTKSGIVDRVVGLYNSLGVIQPATILGCPPELPGVLMLSFYGSSAKVLATASSSMLASAHWPASAAAWACFPITIRLAGRGYPSLSGNVISPLQELLHTKLTS